MAGDLLTGVTRSQQVIKVPESEKIIVTVITDNLADILRPSYKIAERHMSPSVLDSVLHAEHGLAYQIETVVNGESHSCLFDFGVDPRGVMKNMKLLNIDFAKVEALGLSHDHFDHQAALIEILKTKKEAFRKEIPLYVGEQFFVGTFFRMPNGNIVSLLD